MRTSESKGTQQANDSSVALDLKLLSEFAAQSQELQVRHTGTRHPAVA
jgi:hypothetical protein